MNTTNCLVCGSDQKTLVTKQTFPDHYLDIIGLDYKKVSRNIVKCDDCDLTYRDPILDDGDLEILYKRFRDISFRNESPDEYFDRITGLPDNQSENVARINWLHKIMPERFKHGGKILDIGCGGGVFLHTFANMNPGWILHGVEPTLSFSELASRRLGCKVFNGPYKPRLFTDKFDLITINQVLEHVQSPLEFLRGVAQDLKKNGFIYIEVPDIRDFDYLPPDHDRFLMQHLSIFSSETLRITCQKAGLHVYHVKHAITIRQRHNLIAVCGVEDI